MRRAARSRGPRPAAAGFGVGVLAVLSLAIPYSAPQAIFGTAAVALGLAARARPEARSGSLRLAGVAIVLGLLTILAWISFVIFTIATGDWPVGAE